MITPDSWGSEVREFNPYHDARGRFTTKGAATARGEPGFPPRTVEDVAGYKASPRFGSHIQRFHDEAVAAVRAYLRDPVGTTLAKVTVGPITTVVTRGNLFLHFHASAPDLPVPGGRHMGFWDENAGEMGISKATYDSLPWEKRAEIAATIQATKYVPEQYWTDRVSFYYPEIHEEWWFGGGSAEWETHWSVQNEYWRKRLGGKA